MKTMIATACALLLGASLHAQTNMTQPVIANGGFIAVTAAPTRISGATGLLVGGGICGIFGSQVRIGLLGAGLTNDVHGRGATPASRRVLAFGYGGFYGEYVINPESPVHFSAYTLVGAGGLDYSGPIEEPEPAVAKVGGIDADFGIDPTTDAFFIAEPGISVEANVIENIRVSAGAGYRVVYGVATDGVSNGTISGPVATLMVRVGVF